MFSSIVRQRLSLSELSKDSNASVQKKGWMEKRGQGTLGYAWRRRWFVITGDSVHYLKQEDSPTVQGTISLRGATVSKVPGVPGQTKRFELRIKSQGDGRIFELSCETEEEQSEWSEALSTAASSFSVQVTRIDVDKFTCVFPSLTICRLRTDETRTIYLMCAAYLLNTARTGSSSLFSTGVPTAELFEPVHRATYPGGLIRAGQKCVPALESSSPWPVMHFRRTAVSFQQSRLAPTARATGSPHRRCFPSCRTRWLHRQRSAGRKTAKARNGAASREENRGVLPSGERLA